MSGLEFFAWALIAILIITAGFVILEKVTAFELPFAWWRTSLITGGVLTSCAAGIVLLTIIVGVDFPLAAKQFRAMFWATWAAVALSWAMETIVRTALVGKKSWEDIETS